MNGKPLVSIITPAYNAGAYLGDTIRSVLAQTYSSFEHIVVDDGSTDDTAKVVRAISDPRIKYLYQKNSGQSSARNAGIAAAKGKYIAFLDADDLFLPGKLSEQVNYLETNPNCDFCYCKIYHFFHDEPDRLYYLKMEHPSGYLFGRLLMTNFINPLSAVVRRDIFEKHGAFEPSYRWADEQYVWLKLSYRKVRFCYIDKVLAYYRLHRQSFTNRPRYFLESQKECLQILKVVKTWMSEAEVEEYQINKLERKRRIRIVLGMLMASGNLLTRPLLALYLLNRRRKLKYVGNGTSTT
ncbi:glycosyltransferase [Candidatus Parcubacteria bacterium]|nr:MAG: glycosyltransferase [Candidatus Parcubacteria bacterium]